MQNFRDWFFDSQESSASTRARNAAFWGLGPPVASPFSHSTPHPGMVDKLLDDLKPKKKKRKKKKKVDENTRTPDYSFDSFVRKRSQEKEQEEFDRYKDLTDLEQYADDLADDEEEDDAMSDLDEPEMDPDADDLEDEEETDPISSPKFDKFGTNS